MKVIKHGKRTEFFCNVKSCGKKIEFRNHNAKYCKECSEIIFNLIQKRSILKTKINIINKELEEFKNDLLVKT